MPKKLTDFHFNLINNMFHESIKYLKYNAGKKINSQGICGSNKYRFFRTRVAPYATSFFLRDDNFIRVSW